MHLKHEFNIAIKIRDKTAGISEAGHGYEGFVSENSYALFPILTYIPKVGHLHTKHISVLIRGQTSVSAFLIQERNLQSGPYVAKNINEKDKTEPLLKANNIRNSTFVGKIKIRRELKNLNNDNKN